MLNMAADSGACALGGIVGRESTDLVTVCAQDCSFPAYFYTQPMATGPGFYDNLCPQSWQDGSAATFTLQDPHQQTFDCPGN